MTHFFLTNRSEEYCQGGGNLIPSRVRVGEARGEDFGVLRATNEVRTGKILVEFFFYKFMDRAAGEVHKLAKKERDQHFPSTDRTS